MIAIFGCLVRVYTICHSQQSDKGLDFLSFSAVWSGSTLFAFLAFWSGSTLCAILSSLISVYTIFHSQSDQGLHNFPHLSCLINVYAVILSSLIRVYTFCHSQQPQQGQGSLSSSGTVWTGSTLFAILISLIRVYTVCHSLQSDQGLHYFPFAAVWSVSTLFAILSLIGSTLLVILSCLIRVHHNLTYFLSRRFMYLVISLLVYRAGCGIWLYQFLIIAYLFT